MKERIQRVQEHLAGWKIDALLIDQPVDLYYLLGLDMSRGRLVVRQQGAHLYVDGRYFDAAQKASHVPVSLWGQQTMFREERIGFDSCQTTVASLRALEKEAPQAQWSALARPLKAMRAAKDKSEVARLRAAAALTWRAVLHVKSLLRVGVSEEELAFEFEWFVRKGGASSLSFPAIIAFGKNSAYPHYRAGKALLEKNQIVLIDVGVVMDHYCSDVTRVLFFGDVDVELRRRFELVRRASLAAQKAVRIGEKIGAIDKEARRVFADAGMEALFTHSLGHGVGLDVHEYPLVKWDSPDAQEELCSAMVMTIEPGLYQPGLGGIRLEDTGIVTEKGFESFYPPIQEMLYSTD